MIKAKRETNLSRATLEFALFGLNLGVVASVGLVAVLQNLNGGSGVNDAIWNGAIAVWALGPAVLILIPLIGALITMLAFFLICALIRFLAHRLGGRGTFSHNAFLVSRVIFPFSLASIGVGFLAAIPWIGLVLPPMWVIYSAWLWSHVIHVANDLPLARSVVVLAIVVGFIGLVNIIL